MRRLAEARLKGTKSGTGLPLAENDARRMVHELQVHQIELELQNEELKIAREELERQFEKYSDLYNFAPVGYFTLDDDGTIREVNLTGANLLGVERSRLAGKPFSSFLSGESQYPFQEFLGKVCRGVGQEACEVALQGDRLRFIRIEGTAIQSGGEVRQCRVAVINITRHMRSEEALKISETRYRRLFETAQDGILILDAETGQISDVNYSHEDFLGKKLWEIGAFEDVEASKAAFEELQAKGYVRYEDLPLRTKDGRPIAVEFVSNVYLVNHHKVIQCNIRDITERKLIAEALQKAHDELERRVEERTVELQTALSEIKIMKDRLETENIYLRQEFKMRHQFEHILGQSDGLKYVLYRAEQVAPTNTTVLILGETGTGKELIAAAIHHMSPRKDRPLITVNCAALPANLMESELFGREKGAFTGADSRQVGRFEIANGSTLCLDEIGELPLEMQAKLLRAIQHGEFERLGSSHTIKVDVRIVATTNRNLEEEVRKGRFRQDLYYRLNVFPITVPPLRQRKDDIPLLVQAFVERYARKLGKQILSIQKETMKTLQDYPWPGNVRELESVLERAVILCPGPTLLLDDKLETLSSPLPSTARTLEEIERNQILRTLIETRWRINGKDGAAAILGLHPSTLRARMHKLGITRPEAKVSD
ncbi:MAG: sigma 54-interacting transcriptional regulator [Syntrophorhabdales bacterium]